MTLLDSCLCHLEFLLPVKGRSNVLIAGGEVNSGQGAEKVLGAMCMKHQKLFEKPNGFKEVQILQQTQPLLAFTGPCGHSFK